MGQANNSCCQSGVAMNKFLASVACASKGIRHALATERNMRVHLFVFLLAVIAALVLEVSKIEFLLILGISALTFSLELTNTAIERLADKVSPVFNREIGLVKDVMAGAVLVASVFAVIIGFIIFIEPLMKLLNLP